MLLRPGLEGRWVQAERKDMDGAGRTFWKGSEYFPGLGRSGFNTCSFPGHTLFLESIMYIKGAERQGHTEARGQSRSDVDGQTRVHGGRAGAAGEARNTGKQVADHAGRRATRAAEPDKE